MLYYKVLAYCLPNTAFLRFLYCFLTQLIPLFCLIGILLYSPFKTLFYNLFGFSFYSPSWYFILEVLWCLVFVNRLIYCLQLATYLTPF